MNLGNRREKHVEQKMDKTIRLQNGIVEHSWQKKKSKLEEVAHLRKICANLES